MLPPVIQKNYGKWKYHEILKPRAETRGRIGEELYSVRAGSARLLSTDHIREICEFADKYCDGYLRFTAHNIEFLLTDKSKVDPNHRPEEKDYPVGGTAIR